MSLPNKPNFDPASSQPDPSAFKQNTIQQVGAKIYGTPFEGDHQRDPSELA